LLHALQVEGRVPDAINPVVLGQRARSSIPEGVDPSRLGDHFNGAMASAKQAVRLLPLIVSLLVFTLECAPSGNGQGEDKPVTMNADFTDCRATKILAALHTRI
jgi:hypothetical protein